MLLPVYIGTYMHKDSFLANCNVKHGKPNDPLSENPLCCSLKSFKFSEIYFQTYLLLWLQGALKHFKTSELKSMFKNI